VDPRHAAEPVLLSRAATLGPRRLVVTLAGALCLAGPAGCSPAPASPAPAVLRFELTPDVVASAKVVEQPTGTSEVLVTLTEPEARRFAALTGENVGRELEVVARGRVVVRATIRAAIDSGMIGIRGFASPAEALAFATSLVPPEPASR
jgi:hypothetical protein